MGRDANVKKDRTCRFCKSTFSNLTSEQIAMHAVVCRFEKLTGIEIISMNVPEERSSEIQE
jgi:hypothetical protein